MPGFYEKKRRKSSAFTPLAEARVELSGRGPVRADPGTFRTP